MTCLAVAAAVLAAGCDGDPDPDDDSSTSDDDTTVADDDSAVDDDDSVPAQRWQGSADVRVVDGDGVAVEGLFVMVGGATEDRWAVTGADGRVTVEVADDGMTDRWVLAGGEGWTTGGADIDDLDGPSGELEIVVHALPDPADDNDDYDFQPGGSSMSMDTTECGHCHPTKADDWNASGHHAAGNNVLTWALYTGGVAVDQASCEILGGWIGDGQEPGVGGGVVQRCYLGDDAGVLPFLHDGCGDEGQPTCDHPDHQADLETFGSCGDCHTPAVDHLAPGTIDMARATGFAHTEGVTCDVCHKARSVAAGPDPGRDGALQLQRPSEPTNVFGQDFDPITFGPYPDVAIVIMKGSYAPQMRDPSWCSGCHEYARGALRDDQQVDAQRWPDGLPIGETWSEFEAGPYAQTSVTCQRCHMGVLHEQSSTYDITPNGLTPSVDQGWLRSDGEVVHHDFDYAQGTPGLDLALSLEQVGNDVVASATVLNQAAGHAMPTGEPMRQLLVLLQARDPDGNVVDATGGRAIPDVGGYLAVGEVGVDAAVAGSMVQLPGVQIPGGVITARFVRPTGQWDDYAGPGTASFAGLAAQDRGLLIDVVLGQRAVLSVSGDTVTLDGPAPELLPGDQVWLCGVDDVAGAAGWLYAKVLLDDERRRGVPHFRAVDMASDNRLGPLASETTQVIFPTLPPLQDLVVTATLVLRRHAAPVASRYGWSVDDVELATQTATYTVLDY